MNFEDQIEDVEVFEVTIPRTYIRWKNTEEGRDKIDCYERISILETGEVFYINTYNRNSYIMRSHSFWNTLEKLYRKGINKN